MPLGYNISASGRRNEYVSLSCRPVHSHYAATVHRCLQRLYRIYFCNYDVCAHALCPHCDAAPAVAIACNDHCSPRNKQISGVHYRIPYRLACAVLIIVIVLAHGVVYVHHRELQHTGFFPRLEPVYAGGSLLRPAYKLRGKLRPFKQRFHKVAAVVDYKVWPAGERLNEQLLIPLIVNAVLRICIHAEGGKPRRNVVLRRKRVAAGRVYLGAAGGKAERKVCRLCFHVYRGGYLHSLKGLFRIKAFFYCRKGGHKILHPKYLHPAVLCKGHIANNAHSATSLCCVFVSAGLILSAPPYSVNRAVFCYNEHITL